MPDTLPHTLSAAMGDAGTISLDGGHVMHWQAFGPSAGLPVVVLHGGPGTGLSLRLCTLVSQAGPFRVIAFDQRGCGASQPRGEVRHNTLGHLVRDIEVLRTRLGIARWLVVGGSWGATLAAAYAAHHPDVVTGVLLRGLFVPAASEIHWFFQDAAALHPTPWQLLAKLAPTHARHALLPWLATVFAEGPPALQRATAQAWMGWEQVLGNNPAAPPSDSHALATAIDRYRIQTHYLLHQCWLGNTGVARACRKLQMPLLFVHGEEDQVCRPAAAQSAWRASPSGRWHLVPGAGHDPFHPAMANAVIQALHHFAEQHDFADTGVTA